MFVANGKTYIAFAIISTLSVVGFLQPAKAEPITLDCIAAPGVTGGGNVGWRVVVDYSTNTVVWFGLLGGNGSPDYALATSAPAEINETTIKWQVRFSDGGVETVSINRSTGEFFWPKSNPRNLLTAQCNLYQGPPARKF
jgi:hypothetical protein